MSELGWLKRSLESASTNVSHWPDWKRELESALSAARASRLDTPAPPPQATVTSSGSSSAQ